MANVEEYFHELWKHYITIAPTAQKIFDLFTLKGEKVVNDHIALRTCNDPRVSIDVLAKPFLELGYEQKEHYLFKEKKLQAFHYEHKDKSKNHPKVFISELIMHEMPDFIQKELTESIDCFMEKRNNHHDINLAGRTWPATHALYEKMYAVSEYAAWFYTYGFCVNHFTVLVNLLKNYPSIQSVNELLKENSYKLNSNGGEIKGTPLELLEQSSIMAEKVDVHFEDGIHQIPSCYYEFARRYPNAETGELYQGFIAASADKIFESTNHS